MWKRLGIFAAIVVLLSPEPFPIREAAAETVDLELVLAVDSSLSVDREEFALQMRGLADAFRDPNVIAAIQASGDHGIAVCLVHWASIMGQSLALDWTVIRGAASAERFARRVEEVPRLLVGGSTSITSALKYSIRQVLENRFEGRRMVIDVSGDGRHNQGIGPTGQRDLAVALGITINGLAILNEDRELDLYYRDHVIGGTGAFVITARNFRDFAEAMVRKLVREIAAPPLAMTPKPQRGSSGTISAVPVAIGRAPWT